jgi:hypothetical protein
MFRAVGTPSNMEAFAKAFGGKAGIRWCATGTGAS